jgi:hypothetical protein
VKISKLLLAVIVLLGVSGFAQDMSVQAKPLSDTDINLLRQDVQKAKDQVIKDTMQFTEPQAAAFWPVYKQYAAQQHAIGQKRMGIITDYAQKMENLDDATSTSLIQRMFQVEADTLALRKSYWPKFEKAIGGKLAAKFYQVDNRLDMMIDIQLASQIPLVP